MRRRNQTANRNNGRELPAPVAGKAVLSLALRGDLTVVGWPNLVERSLMRLSQDESDRRPRLRHMQTIGNLPEKR